MNETKPSNEATKEAELVEQPQRKRKCASEASASDASASDVKKQRTDESEQWIVSKFLNEYSSKQNDPLEFKKQVPEWYIDNAIMEDVFVQKAKPGLENLWSEDFEEGHINLFWGTKWKVAGFLAKHVEEPKLRRTCDLLKDDPIVESIYKHKGWKLGNGPVSTDKKAADESADESAELVFNTHQKYSDNVIVTHSGVRHCGSPFVSFEAFDCASEATKIQKHVRGWLARKQMKERQRLERVAARYCGQMVYVVGYDKVLKTPGEATMTDMEIREFLKQHRFAAVTEAKVAHEIELTLEFEQGMVLKAPSTYVCEPKGKLAEMKFVDKLVRIGYIREGYMLRSDAKELKVVAVLPEGLKSNNFPHVVLNDDSLRGYWDMPIRTLPLPEVVWIMESLGWRCREGSLEPTQKVIKDSTLHKKLRALQLVDDCDANVELFVQLHEAVLRENIDEVKEYVDALNNFIDVEDHMKSARLDDGVKQAAFEWLLRQFLEIDGPSGVEGEVVCLYKEEDFNPGQPNVPFTRDGYNKSMKYFLSIGVLKQTDTDGEYKWGNDDSMVQMLINHMDESRLKQFCFYHASEAVADGVMAKKGWGHNDIA